MTLALKREESSTNGLAVVRLQAPISNQYIDEAIAIIKEEIQELCTQTSLLMDCAEEDVQEQLTIDLKLGEKVVARLSELAAAMKFARLGAVSRLTIALGTALKKIVATDQAVDSAQRAAVFATTHLLNRYVDFCVERPQVDAGLIIAPSFHKLAKARLISHAVESDLIESTFIPNDLISRSESISVAELGEFGDDTNMIRRSRQMYQVALIALLRGDDSVEPLNIIQRVCEHNNRSDNEAYREIWSQLAGLVEYFKSRRLALELQRCYLFSRFDRLLRAVSKRETISFTQGEFSSIPAELELLMRLADEKRSGTEALLGDFSQPLGFNESGLQEERQKLESGVVESMQAVCIVCQERLSHCKNKLAGYTDAPEEHKESIDDIKGSLVTVLKVAEFNSITYLSNKLQASIALYDQWVESNYSSDFEVVASSLLAAENAATWLGKQATFDFSDDSEQPLLQDAQITLCDEIQANLGLATRALTTYTESNFDVEHIANLNQSLNGAASGFKMLEHGMLEELLTVCAQAIEARLDGNTKQIDSAMELVADSLVTADGFINEIKKFRKPNSLFEQIINENTQLLKQKIEG